MRPAFTDILRRLREEEGGNVAIETMIFAPIFAGAFLALGTLWDAFSARTDSLRATYAIADSLSRTYDEITAAEIEELEDLFAFIARAQDPNDVAVRVSLVKRALDDDGESEHNELEWSYSTASSFPAHQTVADVQEIVPAMAVGEIVIVTETFNPWAPAWGGSADSGTKLGIGDFDGWTFSEAVAMRPRFVGQVPFD